MYKILYLKTGHVFSLPEEVANDLKKSFPEEYKIIEKNGKIVKEKFVKKKNVCCKSEILEKVLDKTGRTI